MFGQKSQADYLNNNSPESQWVSLNTKKRSIEADEFEQALLQKVVAQDEAVQALSQIYQVYLSNLNIPGKPLGTLLFLGPTGSGKTRSVEAAAEVLFGDAHAIIKIDCAEFQHSHEISKLIGAPPGYLGHRETPPLLTQENLNRYHTLDKKLTLVLFDEIEKASDVIWHLLLGVLDKATLTLGDNRQVDFSNCIVVLTSNLGAREMNNLTDKMLGFSPPPVESEALNKRLNKIGVESARRKFSPEFMNRLDKVVVFQSLSQEALYRIIDVEFAMLQRRILDSGQGPFIIRWSERVKDFLLLEGFDRRYGARPLKRVIERYIVLPLSNLIATKQIVAGDVVFLEVDESGADLTFRKIPEPLSVASSLPKSDTYRLNLASM
ncbi:MAG: ATP-dependent Clp protease ATP-binding subunit [Acidobacteria bacterium]|nr:ATP-dependent Clp protease ATP-binding subunit [Acidobacteriota bacterium]